MALQVALVGEGSRAVNNWLNLEVGDYVQKGPLMQGVLSKVDFTLTSAKQHLGK